jgi:hypothetical protein
MVPLQTRFNHGASATQYTVEHHHRSNDDGYASIDGDSHDYDTTRVQREYTQTLIRPLSLMRMKEAYLSNFVEGDESYKTVESPYGDDDDGGDDDDADVDDDDEVARGSRTLRRDAEYKQQSVNEVSVVEYYHGEDNDGGSSMSELRSRTDFDYKDRAHEYEHHPPPTPATPSPLPLALVSPSSSSNIMHPMVSTPAYDTNTPYSTGETIVSGISSSAFSTELIGSNPPELKRPISFRFRSPVSPLYVGDVQETISSSINIDRLHNIPNTNINVSDDNSATLTMNSSPVNIQLDPSRSNKYDLPPVYQDNRSNTSPVLTQNYHHHGNHFVSYQNQTNISSVSSHEKSIPRPIVVSSSSSSSPVSHQQSYSITHLHSTAPIQSSSSSSSNRSVTIVEETPPDKTRSIIQDNRTVSALSRSSVSSSASSSTKHHASKSNVSHHRVVQIITTGSTTNLPLIHTTNSTYSHNSNTVSSSLKLFKSLDESSDLSEHSDSTTSSLSSFEVLNDSSNAAIAITDTAGLSPNGGGMESYTNNLQQSININMNQSGGVGGDGIGVLLHVDDDLSYNNTDDVDIAATLGEHVSTITSAPLAMQSDLDVASSSIPSKSSKSPTNATADRYYRRFKKRAAALDGGGGGGLGNNVNTTPTAANILLGTMTIHPVSSIISNRSTSADDSISITTPTGSAASSSIYRNKAVDKDQFQAYVLQGDAANARLILRNYSTTNRNNLLVDANEATDLMIQLFSTRSQHLNVDIVKLLVDGLNANINGMELLSGRRPLHYTIDLNHAEIGSYLIARGADVFAQDNTGSCPLVMSLNNHLTWLLQAYEESGMQSKLLTSNNNSTQIADFTSYLVLAGYSKHVSSLLKAGLITITSEEATALLTSCHGNFENMLEPIDMFELLESLGAAI